MTILQHIFSVYVSALGTILGTPQVEPDPALIAQLEQERPAAVGKNGADALFALPQAPAVPTFQCETDSTDCLAKARQNLTAYHAAAKQHKNAWQAQEKAIATLRQYEHFRYTTTYESPLPPYDRIFRQRILAAYRFADGEKTAAIESLCTSTAVGLHLLNNDQNGLFPGLMATGLIAANTTLLAEMLAGSPADIHLPTICDEIKVQPAENLSLCPHLAGEWEYTSAHLERFLQEILGILKNMEDEARQNGFTTPAPRKTFINMVKQAQAYISHESTRFCSAENKAAVARGELPDLNPDPNARAQYCSPYNFLCDAWTQDYTPFQARLLNVNRYLTALDYLRHPTDTPPAGYRIENNTLTFTRYPDREDEEGMQTVTLPLPGSRQNSTTQAR